MENKATEIIQQLHMLSQIIYKEYFKIRKPASLMTNNPTSLCFLFSLNIRYEPSREMKSQWTAVWVKISSSWIGIVLYVWTLVAPLVLTNRDFDWMGLEAWKSYFDHHLFEISSIPNFCEVVCVCFPCNFSSLLAWIRFTACHFIHCSLAKRISMRFRMNQELYEYVGGKLGEVDIVRFILCSVPVKRVKTKLLGSLIFKLC